MRDQFEGESIVLENALAFALHNAYQRLRTATYQEFNRRGLELTPEQWIVLVRLWQRDPRTPSELSESTLRDRPTMTRILDTMEKHGLVVRKLDPRDGRGREVHLTPLGRGLRRRLFPVARKLVERIEDGISEADLLVTRRTLRRIAENLS